MTSTVDLPNIVVTNHSGLPLLRISVTGLRVKTWGDGSLWWCPVQHPAYRDEPLAAGKSWCATAESEFRQDENRREKLIGDEFTLIFWFVDASGLHWKREGNGTPVLVGP
ncbi:hypothetical protein ABTX60_42080 [Streptomyces sp. NPDC126510]|uniref:hypothetical protein n=1 Tax=Streptomyces sp. NPDC126510 TaxID=3155317 RepID=UPI00332547CB